MENVTIPQTQTLEELISKTKEHLEFLNYSPNTLKIMKRCWIIFKNYASLHNETYFTTKLGHQFLEEQYGIEAFEKLYNSYKRTMRRSIAVLSDYQRDGIIYKRQPERLHNWAEGYYEICESFIHNYVQKRFFDTTQRQYKTYLNRLVCYFAKIGKKDISEISEKEIDGYFVTYAGYSKATISLACHIIKTFFKYALNQGYLKNDLTIYLPSVKVNHRSNLPSVFTTDEIKKLLTVVDRSNPKGKRDYAMLILAVRYGMRVGEITGLKLNNLDFETRKISYIQSKTQSSVSKDMLEDVGWALLDYLKNGRPTTDCLNVFVRMVAPYDAFGKHNNLNALLQRYLARAGIQQTGNRHYGMHTIRHSFASHLLEQGNSLHAISKAMEHVELNSTMIYTKVDLNMLELCALEASDDTN